MSVKLILKDVRCSYVFVHEPRPDSKNDEGDTVKGGYGIQVLPEKGSADAKKIKKAIKQVLIDAVGEAKAKKLGKFKLPLRDGDEERDGDEYDGYYFMNCNTYKGRKPGLVNRQNETPTEEDIEELCYSGAYFIVSITLYYFDGSRGGKAGVGARLDNVMLRKKGERLDGAVAARDEFADYAEDSDDDDDDDDDDDWDDD